ncbi:MAG TPA: HNH endonuclease signature motif containing protein [Thermoanaerobaculia bacterium]|nr:HNH endonuclease signature motif containing protein [Thermoanaerobaculia bacterium]
MPTESERQRDTRIRLTVFAWLEEQTRIHGDVLPWSLLAHGLYIDSERVPLVSQQGIFKPRVLPELPLSIRTSAEGPYDDHFGRDGETLLYAYRGIDPMHPDNVRLRKTMAEQVPLVYFHGVVAGKYLAVWPVYVVGDDPGALRFSVVADQPALVRDLVTGAGVEAVRYTEDTDFRRRYTTTQVRQRLHQQGFRERVLAAYHEQCALCRLRHPELLEAAHIIPDNEPGGEPIVPNGLSLCRLHHGAFDTYLLGIRPDYTVDVRRSVLDETDGPMLLHGLQGVHNQRIWTPRSAELKPDRDLLERRYERFRKAG